MKVTIELEEEQVTAVLRALELYARLGIGQTEYVHEVLSGIQTDAERADIAHRGPTAFDTLKRLNPEDLAELPETIILVYKRLMTGFGIGSSKGIHNTTVPPGFKRAWELRNVLRHAVSWAKNPDGGPGVDYDEPRKLDKDDPVPLPTVTVTK